MATQGELRTVLEARLATGAVTLDLGGLVFVDTSGLRLILETAEAAGRGGTSFVVLPGGPAVKRLFEVAGVAGLDPLPRRSVLIVLTDEAEAALRLEVLIAAGELADGAAPLDEVVARVLDSSCPRSRISASSTGSTAPDGELRLARRCAPPARHRPGAGGGASARAGRPLPVRRHG